MKLKILYTAVVAIVMGTASPAVAYDQPLVINITYFFSDSEHTMPTGRTKFEYCTYDFNTNGAVYSLIGSTGAYHYDVPIGYCDEGNFEPY